MESCSFRETVLCVLLCKQNMPLHVGAPNNPARACKSYEAGLLLNPYVSGFLFQGKCMCLFPLMGIFLTSCLPLRHGHGVVYLVTLWLLFSACMPVCSVCSGIFACHMFGQISVCSTCLTSSDGYLVSCPEWPHTPSQTSQCISGTAILQSIASAVRKVIPSRGCLGYELGVTQPLLCGTCLTSSDGYLVSYPLQCSRIEWPLPPKPHSGTTILRFIASAVGRSFPPGDALNFELVVLGYELGVTQPLLCGTCLTPIWSAIHCRSSHFLPILSMHS